ncbi:uncharacterized protein G2W53_020007 [Senna tora]|uniref:Uncharacterized protein n=1 Tax=Senna tora TaxID=362788 RepID=A0A834WPQ8_9FABA|nr:uncharacterized protein G2W53_020007 [Senna tora]
MVEVVKDCDLGSMQRGARGTKDMIISEGEPRVTNH